MSCASLAGNYSLLDRMLIPCNPRVDVVLVLEGLDGEGQGGRGRGCAEGRRKDVGNVSDEPERKCPGENH